MNTRILARAPGKLLLLGEYAVLDGCPAVVAAVDRMVEVSLELDESPGNTIRISSAAGSAEFSSTGFPAESGPLRFVIAALGSALSCCAEIARRNLAISITSHLDDPQGTKVGLGSSAAVTVGVIAAIFAAAGKSPGDRASRDRLYSVALDAHRRIQGKLGSGADVAASVYGGLLLFEPRNGAPQITTLTLPADAHLLTAWTGEPASTPDLVNKYRSAENGSAAKRASFVRASRAAVEEFVTALAHGSLALNAVQANGELLEQLASDLALPLLTPRLRRLVTVARAAGAGAKISGAGGGDCGIALTGDRNTAQRVRAAWQAAGLTPLDVSICAEGVSIGYR